MYFLLVDDFMIYTLHPPSVWSVYAMQLGGCCTSVITTNNSKNW